MQRRSVSCRFALAVDIASVSVQFLPQDKVVEFAKLKPVDLLLETEKAVGDSTLHGKHEKLIEERRELHRLEQVSIFGLVFDLCKLVPATKPDCILVELAPGKKSR